MTRINYHDMDKKKYSRPTICTVRGSELMQTPPLNFGTGTIDGNEGGALSKMTPFVEPEERGDIADEYFERSSAPQIDFGNIWADE